MPRVNPITLSMFKRCPKCGNEYLRTPEFFTRHKGTYDGLNCWCKVCTYGIAKQWYGANKERATKRHRDYYDKHIDHFRKYGYEQHSANRDKERKQALARQKANPEAVKEANKRYRDRRQNAQYADHPFDKQAQLNSQSGLCFYCGLPLTDKFHVDHKTPLVRGGSDHPDNKVVCCPTCNLSKRDKTAEEFLEWRKIVGAE